MADTVPRFPRSTARRVGDKVSDASKPARPPRLWLRFSILGALVVLSAVGVLTYDIAMEPGSRGFWLAVNLRVVTVATVIVVDILVMWFFFAAAARPFRAATATPRGRRTLNAVFGSLFIAVAVLLALVH